MTSNHKKDRPKFRSGLEERIYDEAIERGYELAFEPADAHLNYSIPTKYIPDFVLPNGIRIEAKGWLRPRDRAKMLRVKKENKGIDIRFVFQRANSRIGRSTNSLMYWQWAEKHGFPWSEGTIPEEWFKEKSIDK